MTITKFAVVRRSVALPVIVAAVAVGCQKTPEVAPSAAARGHGGDADSS